MPSKKITVYLILHAVKWKLVVIR